MSELCKEKTSLLLEYTDLTKVYSELVNELHFKHATMSVTDHHRLLEVAEEARLSSEKARVALELHIRDHRC